jgi:hypothetical protein
MWAQVVDALEMSNSLVENTPGVEVDHPCGERYIEFRRGITHRQHRHCEKNMTYVQTW